MNSLAITHILAHQKNAKHGQNYLILTYHTHAVAKDTVLIFGRYILGVGSQLEGERVGDESVMSGVGEVILDMHANTYRLITMVKKQLNENGVGQTKVRMKGHGSSIDGKRCLIASSCCLMRNRLQYTHSYF